MPRLASARRRAAFPGRVGTLCGRLTLRPLAERPRCSIVIPCYNEERYIEDVLRCAVQQRYPPDLLEIFVVDGGSIDLTREIVGRMRAR